MTSVAQTAGVLSFEQAYAAVLDYCRHLAPPQTKEVMLLDALGRVLAEPIAADRDFPPFPRATRDGYAVRASDVSTVPATLRVVGQIQAGAAFAGRLAPGQTVEIMTGAAVPEGADAVVMVEYTLRVSASDQVEVQRAVATGENVVARGAEAAAGQHMMAPGTRFGAAQVALAAACGKARISVYRKPRVAILATGDELVEVSKTPGPFQIRNSNTYSLAAQVETAGGEPMRLPVAPDEPRKLAFLIYAGLEADMLLLSGGVSMGKFDLVEQQLKKLGAEFFFIGARIQPGGPVVFGEVRFSREGNGSQRGRAARDPRVLARIRGRHDGVPFFGLPGNPVSTMVCFDLFARPVLQALGGAAPSRLPSAKARLTKEVRTKTGLTRFLPAMLEGGVADAQVAAIAWQGSGDVLASARANCYLVIPPDRDTIAAGEMVTVMMR